MLARFFFGVCAWLTTFLEFWQGLGLSVWIRGFGWGPIRGDILIQQFSFKLGIVVSNFLPGVHVIVPSILNLRKFPLALFVNG